MYKKAHIIVEDDPNYIDVVSTIFFQNQGTRRVIIDGHIVLNPLEHFKERADPGCAIMVEYNITFEDMPPGTAPEDDKPRIWEGNRLLIRTLKRNSYE